MPLVFQLNIVTQSVGGETAKGQYPKATFYFDFAKKTFSPGPKLLVCSMYNIDTLIYISKIFFMVAIKVGRKSFNQCGVVRDTTTESSYIVLAGGKTKEKEITTSEVVCPYLYG